MVIDIRAFVVVFKVEKINGLTAARKNPLWCRLGYPVNQVEVVTALLDQSAARVGGKFIPFIDLP